MQSVLTRFTVLISRINVRHPNTEISIQIFAKGNRVITVLILRTAFRNHVHENCDHVNAGGVPTYAVLSTR